MTKSGALAKLLVAQEVKRHSLLHNELPRVLRGTNAAPKQNAYRLAPAQRPQPDLYMDHDQLDSGDGCVFDL